MSAKETMGPVAGKKLEELLDEWIAKEGTEAASVCAVGLRNEVVTRPMVNPRWHCECKTDVVAGCEPPNGISWGMASASLFAAQTVSSTHRGACGCVWYEWAGLPSAIGVAWEVAEDPQESRFAAMCMPAAATTSGSTVFRELMDQSVPLGQTIARKDLNFVLFARMKLTSAMRAVVVVEVANDENAFAVSRPLEPARERLETGCRAMLSECIGKVAIAIGVANLTCGSMANVRSVLEAGRFFILPCDHIAQGSASALLVCKAPMALRGVAGCLAIDIKPADDDGDGDSDSDDGHRPNRTARLSRGITTLLIAFSIPFSEKLGENQFNVHVVPHSEADGGFGWETYRKMATEWSRADDGEIWRHEQGYRLRAFMATGPKATLLVYCSDD
jgi:hypothetical protein